MKRPSNPSANRDSRTTRGLPPGQRAVQGLPRFGIESHAPPRIPHDAIIDVAGALIGPVSFSPAELAGLPRRTIDADLHCVAGWSAVGLRWAGVAFDDVYRLLIRPRLAPGAQVSYLVFVGWDGYRSIVTLADALAENVLLADELDGRPLPPEHGAPLRLVSPDQYGFISTKHLRRIELYPSEPPAFYHPVARIQRALRTVRPHPRARVWREERHRFVPSWPIRRIYRLLVRLPAPPLDPAASDVAEGTPRWAVASAWATVACVLPSAGWRTAVGLGVPLGWSEAHLRMEHIPGLGTLYVIGLSAASIAAAALTLGLVYRWGEQVPAGVPLLGGRPIPVWPVVAAAVVGALLVAAIVWLSVTHWSDVSGFSDRPSSGWALLMIACYAPAMLWPPLLLATTYAYVRRRAGRRR